MSNLQLNDRRLVRRLIEVSLGPEGRPEELRVEAVLRHLRSFPARRRRALLEAYRRRLRRIEYLATLSIEHAGPLDPGLSDSLAASMATAEKPVWMVTTEESPQLIAGLRLRHGDDLFDISVAGRLQRLSDGSLSATL